jgi:hypothetical protein
MTGVLEKGEGDRHGGPGKNPGAMEAQSRLAHPQGCQGLLEEGRGGGRREK